MHTRQEGAFLYEFLNRWTINASTYQVVVNMIEQVCARVADVCCCRSVDRCAFHNLVGYGVPVQRDPVGTGDGHSEPQPQL
jgi:hypothetical protein